LPLLEDALRARPAGDWQGALDGLVTLATTDAVRVIESVLDDESSKPDPDDEFIAELRESLQQAYAAHAERRRPDQP